MAYTTIDDPTQYVNTVIWTGDIQDSDGTGHDQAVTGVGFQPDWIWHKCRSHANQHIIVDSVRGTGGSPTQMLGLNSAATAGDVNSNTNGWIESIDSDGYTVTSGSDSSGKSNNAGANGRTYVAWNWLAGGSASSNSDGDITSSVSANTTSGFSIVSYTGTGSNATIGHGLGSAPKFIIVKNRDDGTKNWVTQITALGNNYLELNKTNATFSGSSYFNNTAPTSSVFTVGTVGSTNASSDNFIAYCFSEVKGYSKIGSYTGNGNTNGTFVYTGFRPAWILLKDYTSSSGYNWIILDNKRDPSNSLDRRLQPSTGFAEYTDVSDFCDFTSNGFKWRGSQANWNASGVGYIYLAFAESPFVNSNGIPTNAR